MKRYLLAALLLAAPLAFCQVDVTSVSGIVKDASGAAVPGAGVDVTNISTNRKYTTATSAKGEYSVPALPAGGYSVSVYQSGI